MKKQNGFTILELLIVVGFFAFIGLAIFSLIKGGKWLNLTLTIVGVYCLSSILARHLSEKKWEDGRQHGFREGWHQSREKEYKRMHYAIKTGMSIEDVEQTAKEIGIEAWKGYER